MRALLFILSILLFGCQKEPAPPISIEGKWQQLVPYHPEWEYNFEDNILTQSITDFGVVITSLSYTYAERNDTVFIGGNATNAPRTWVIRYVGDCAAEVRQLPSSEPGLGFNYVLERL